MLAICPVPCVGLCAEVSRQEAAEVVDALWWTMRSITQPSRLGHIRIGIPISKAVGLSRRRAAASLVPLYDVQQPAALLLTVAPLLLITRQRLLVYGLPCY